MADPRIKELAFDALASTLGAPVDFATQFLRPFGYTAQPVLGSQYIRERLPQPEMQPPSPQQAFTQAATPRVSPLDEVPQIDEFGRVVRPAPVPERQYTPLENLVGGIEATEGVLRGIANLPIAMGGAVVESIREGDVSPRAVDRRMSSILDRLGYKPKTEAGRERLGQAGEFFERLETEYKLPPISASLARFPNVGIQGTMLGARMAAEGAGTGAVRAITGKPDITTEQIYQAMTDVPGTLRAGAPAAAPTLSPTASAVRESMTAPGGVSIRQEQLDQPTRQTLMRGQDIPPMTRPPTPEEIEIARADTRMGQNIVADRLNVIVPEAERVRGGVYRPGQPDGTPWTALTPEQLAQRGEGFKGTDDDLARMWRESIDEASAAGKQAVDRTGATWEAFPAASWDRAFQLPLRSQLWYELSGESFIDRLPDLSTREMLTSEVTNWARALANSWNSWYRAGRKAAGVPAAVSSSQLGSNFRINSRKAAPTGPPCQSNW